MPLWPIVAFAASALGPARVIVATQQSQSNTIAAITAAHESAKAAKFLQRRKRRREGADVYYVAEALDKLKVNTTRQQHDAELRYGLEQERLRAAMEQASLPADRSLLETTVQETEENKMEEVDAFKAMYNMYYTMKAAFGAAATAPSCEFLTCGEHGRCVSDGVAASCECKPCFEGNGFICKPASCSPTKRFTAQPMTLFMKKVPLMEDISVSVFQKNRVAIAFRDKAQMNKGFLMLGTAEEADIKWGEMQSFSGKRKAYNPKIIVMPTGRIVVQFRDAPKDGTGYLVGGRINETNASQAIMLKPVGFVKGQAEPAALVQLATSRVVCLYSHPKGAKEQAYGGALFLQVIHGGSLSIIGKYRFADHLVSNIAAVSMRPTSFAVAFRDPPLPDAASNAPSRELSVVWMSMQDEELVVDPHPIVLEPKSKDMGVRDLAMVSENLIALSYQSNADKKTKMAIVKVDPDTHRMKQLGESVVLASGDTPFVKSISTPFMSLAPHTLTYLQHPRKSSVAETCRISARGNIANCQELPWSNTQVSTVAAARLGDGRLVFIFADRKLAPYYQMLGAPGS
jgi:hypothetical protein